MYILYVMSILYLQDEAKASSYQTVFYRVNYNYILYIYIVYMNVIIIMMNETKSNQQNPNN